MEVTMEPGWKALLRDTFEKPWFGALAEALHAQKAQGRTIYPPGKLIFKAFELTPPEQTKVVILGQDPYHSPGQAMGLSFSVPDGVPAPPSLRNIFREVETDLGIHMSGQTDLTPWARQGVFLLNSVLTVEAGKAASHAHLGWTQFTDDVISALCAATQGVVFLLWGRYAQQKAALVDTSRHHVLTAAHPSPLAGGAFFGCRHFSKANALLEAEGKTPINWAL